MAICRFEYAAKVLCGEVRESGGPLAPGRYFTEINIYNPNDRPVTVRKTFVLTIPPGGQKESEPPPPFHEQHPLNPGRAVAVDCQYLDPRVGVAPFYIGF